MTDGKNQNQDLVNAIASQRWTRFSANLEKFAKARGLGTDTDGWFFHALYLAAKEHPELADKRGKGRPRKYVPSDKDNRFVQDIKRLRTFAESKSGGEPVTDDFVAKFYAEYARPRGEAPPNAKRIKNKISEIRGKGLIPKK